jgi:hypothetical protein
MESDAYINAVALLGGGIVSLGAVIAAVVQIRSWIREPFQKLESAIESSKAAHAADIAALASRVNVLTTEMQTLQVHFDPNGGNLRGRIVAIEQKLIGLEMNGAAERAELRGLIVDLRPILNDLRERP